MLLFCFVEPRFVMPENFTSANIFSESSLGKARSGRRVRNSNFRNWKVSLTEFVLIKHKVSP